MNASSSEGSRGVSSCSTTEADAASSPIRGAASPVTTRPPSSSVTAPPSHVMSSRSRSASGERTKTERSELC